VVCTASSLSAALPTLEAVLKYKIAVVSTTEELSYPIRSRGAVARRLDAMAKRARVAVVGTGVNPGFAMDALPIAITSVCEHVDRIEVDRVQDARLRRVPFQQKVGAGLTAEAFAAGVRDGRIRHVGMAESIAMIAEAMGWKLDRVTDVVEPRIADAPVASEAIKVEAGHVAGLIQDGIGYRKGQPIIKLHMEAWFGVPRAYDRVRVFGSPSLDMTIDGGIPGDIATAAMVANSIPKVMRAAPGLRTMLDLPLPSFAGR
jgi:4-hydroxy-tetrahydrodipicolinate reductase